MKDSRLDRRGSVRVVRSLENDRRRRRLGDGDTEDIGDVTSAADLVRVMVRIPEAKKSE